MCESLTVGLWNKDVEPVFGESTFDESTFGESSFDDSTFSESAFSDSTFG